MILAAALAEDVLGADLCVVGLAGAPDRRYTFRMYFIVCRGEPSPLVREHFHALKKDVVGISMGWTVAILAVLATFGGWIQFAGGWHTFGEWLDPIAITRESLALVEPTTAQDYLTSALAVGFGLVGMFVAWTLYGARSRPVPRNPAAQNLLEHKFWFDEPLRPDLLQAGRSAHPHLPARDRGAADRRLDLGRRRRDS